MKQEFKLTIAELVLLDGALLRAISREESIARYYPKIAAEHERTAANLRLLRGKFKGEP